MNGARQQKAMCKPEKEVESKTKRRTKTTMATGKASANNNKQEVRRRPQQRRGKRDKNVSTTTSLLSSSSHHKTKRKSKMAERHANDKPSGGISALIPSLIGLAVLGCGAMAKLGFRGRASVAGIDLGTTNSVICVQALAKGVGEIECIPDPTTGSPIVPSVVSFLDESEQQKRAKLLASSKSNKKKKVVSKLNPHPSHVVVGAEGKRRIDSHPHHTLYNAKRVLGRPATDPAIDVLRGEVEFQIVETTNTNDATDEDDEILDEVGFVVPDTTLPIQPKQVGSYVVNHLMQMTRNYLGHGNVNSAVICVPAKFNSRQRMATYHAFKNAGIGVARVVEEPTAAALAYGLHRKAGVDYILVYDFGGGTLDISLLHVSDGFVDVMGSDGDDRLGGADFDAAVAHFLLKERGGAAVVDRVAKILEGLDKNLPDTADLEEELSSNCPVLTETPLCTSSSFHTLGEQLKIGLSAYPDHDGEVETQCLAPPSSAASSSKEVPTLEEFCSSLEPVTLRLKSKEYDKSVQKLYDRSIVPVQRLLDDLDLTANDIDEVVMVGGTTRMPQIRMLVRQALNKSQLNTHIDPDVTVAYGAASVID